MLALRLNRAENIRMRTPDGNLEQICPTSKEICAVRSDLVRRRYIAELAIANHKKSPHRNYKGGLNSQVLISRHQEAIVRINSFLEINSSCEAGCAVWGRLVNLAIYLPENPDPGT